MLEELYSKEYNASNYNCAHFVKDAWFLLTNENLETVLNGFLTGPKDRRSNVSALRLWHRLERPVAPCIALFQAGGRAPHVGIFIDGKILHLTENGVSWNSIEDVMLCFNKVRFYNVKKDNNS